MTRHLPLQPHVPKEELAQRSRHAPTPVEARRWQLLALIADDLTVKQAARLVALNYDYARRVVHRYNADGPTALRDRRVEPRIVARASLTGSVVTDSAPNSVLIRSMSWVMGPLRTVVISAKSTCRGTRW